MSNVISPNRLRILYLGDQMTPEQYLSRLIRQSPYAKLVISPKSPLRKAINLVTKSIYAHWENVSIDSVPDLFSPQAGPDPQLTHIRDNLLPFFPEDCRERLASVPVGTVYNLEINGFATRTPDGEGAVVCIDNGLQTALNMSNQWIHLFSPEEIRRKNAESDVYAYAAAKFIHWILGLTAKALPPFLAQPQRDPKIVLAMAAEATLVQLNFIVAHEYSHVCLGHIKHDRSTLPTETIKLHELQADECAAKILLEQERSRKPLISHHDLELHLGAIAGVFYASEAILHILHLGRPFTRVYPSPEDRFDRIIETFRRRYGENVMGAGQYIRPFGLVSHVFQTIQANPPKAVAFLSNIAQACRQIGDITEECFVLAVAREVARLAGGDDVAGQIHSYIENTIDEDPTYAKMILDFHL